MAMVFEQFLLEQKARVHQPPEIRKIIGGQPKGGQNRL